MTAPLGYTCIRPRVDPTFLVAPILHRTPGRVTIAHPDGGEKVIRPSDAYGCFDEEARAERAAYQLTRTASQRRKDEIAARRALQDAEKETEKLLRSLVEDKAR